MHNAHKEWRRRVTRRRRDRLRRLKEKYGCAVCGYNERGCALHFAHIDPMTKSPIMYGKSGKNKAGANMSRLYTRIYKDPIKNRQAIKELFEEIRKCQILCAIHHDIEKEDRRESYTNWEIARARAGMPEPPPDTQQDMFI